MPEIALSVGAGWWSSWRRHRSSAENGTTPCRSRAWCAIDADRRAVWGSLPLGLAFGRSLDGRLVGDVAGGIVGSFGHGGRGLTDRRDAVGLEPLLGVVLLPCLLAFRRGVGVEAGTDVVALVVVGVLAEVLLVLGGHDATLGGLLDRQADSATVEVEVDDLDPELFTGRDDPSGRDEQFEKFYVFLLDANPFQPTIRAFEVNDGQTEVDLDAALDEMIELVGERNFDLYDGTGGTITKA